MLGATVKAGETLEYSVSAGRHGYLVLADGSVDLNGKDRLNARDGVAITGPEKITINGVSDAEIVFVDTV